MNQDSPLSPVVLAQNYERYLVPALFLPWSEVLLDYARPQPGDRVLDAACGTGIVSRQLARRLKGQGRIAALDLNPGMLAAARALGDAEGVNVEWRQGSALELPFSNHEFDLVVCQQGVQFFPDQPKALREMHRVLARGGRIVISVNLSLDENPLYKAFNDVFARHMGVPGLAAPFNFGGEAKLQMLLSEAEFSNIKVERVALPANFKSADEFVQGTILGSAAVVPAFAQLNAADRDTLMRNVLQEMRAVLASHIAEDESLKFSVTAAIGYGEVE
jgi:ubiquinone/menaquinone biosynthesis C-methylase UbiE